MMSKILWNQAGGASVVCESVCERCLKNDAAGGIPWINPQNSKAFVLSVNPRFEGLQLARAN